MPEHWGGDRERVDRSGWVWVRKWAVGGGVAGVAPMNGGGWSFRIQAVVSSGSQGKACPSSIVASS